MLTPPTVVMAGLVPAIDAPGSRSETGVVHRDKPGDDEREESGSFGVSGDGSAGNRTASDA
jgi:hypothetical protein